MKGPGFDPRHLQTFFLISIIDCFYSAVYILPFPLDLNGSVLKKIVFEDGVDLFEIDSNLTNRTRLTITFI